ncbi:MAG: PEGA domain-containing protein [Acidobacteriota bacterium]
MNKLTNRTLTVIAILCLTLPTLVSFGQSTQAGQKSNLTYEDWYGDTKKILADHYTGKSVKLKMAIPATRRGLEMFDGSFERGAEATSAESLAQPGDDVTIKSFKLRDHDIELLLLGKTGEKRKGWFFRRPKNPRISIRFSRELTAKDMTIETINRWLSATMDVASLTPAGQTPAGAENSATQASVAPSAEPAPKPAATKARMENPQGLPTPATTSDLAQGNANFAELTIECQGRYARIYIDDSYSGFAPRTIRLRAGTHSILVMADGYKAWEQRLFIPGGKASVVKADLQR